MSFRNLTGEHDWVWGTGKNSYVTENDEIALNVKTRVLSFLGDCFFAPTEGIDWWNFLNYHSSDKLENAVQETIAKTDGVVDVNAIDSYLNANRKINLSYDINTIYTKNLQGEITPITGA